jgi:pyruvate dehydrogenase E1 component beta subunit
MLKPYTRELSYTEAICEALDQAMHQDPSVLVIGEGVPDPKAIFNSTKGLQQTHGKNRVFDMPLSENGMTGICIGAALTGMRPVLVHQRLDFALLSMDQLVNNAAKWSYMFNGQASVPLVVRMIVGRGWGQGPQHSRKLASNVCASTRPQSGDAHNTV